MKGRSFPSLLIGGLIILVASFTQAAQEKVFMIELLDGKMLGPKTMQVKRYDTVRWKVKSNEAGELHMHAYHIEIPVSSSKVSEYSFKAQASGRFQLEWHPAVKSGSSYRAAHQEPLALLEVYPQ